MFQNQPVENVLNYMASEEKGERAQLSNIIGAMSLADLMKTTLGPKGMDKIILARTQNGKVEVTNDGATILKNLHIDNPAAKILVDISKTQDNEVGDGTTSVCVLAGELLREADKLLQKNVHPQTVIEGWRIAHKIAFNALEKSAVDNKDDPKKFKEDLMNIARTTLSSKILNQEKEHFAKIAVDAVLRLKGSTNLDQIQIIKKSGGNLKDSKLSDGFILDKQIGIGQPKAIKNAKILIANTSLDTDKIKIYGAKVRTNSMTTLAEIEKAEKKKMEEKVNKIIDHKCNVFINRQLIYDYPMEIFADKGIMAIEHADFEGIERLALVLGGDITSTFKNKEHTVLGECESIEEIMIGEDKLIQFNGCKRNEACTIILRGASSHLLEEAERSIHDALCVLSQTVNNTRIVYGGGCTEMLMAKAVELEAKKTIGKKALAMESYARALKQIPQIISSNAGYDAAEIVSHLEADHYNGKTTSGLDMDNGEVADMKELGITESFKVKSSVLNYASEAAEMILRVDRIIRCAPRRRQ